MNRHSHHPRKINEHNAFQKIDLNPHHSTGRHGYHSNQGARFVNEGHPQSLAQMLMSEHRRDRLLVSCNNEQAYRDTLQIIIKCLCNEEDMKLQGVIIEILCSLIIQRCNLGTTDDIENDDLIRKGGELLIQASYYLEIQLQRRITRQREITATLMKFASQHPSRLNIENKDVNGLYIPALILARHLYHLQHHEEDEEVVWDRKFYGLLGRLVFAMGFKNEAAYANKKELRLCAPLIEPLTQKSFDAGIARSISFKMMEEPEIAIHTLVRFASLMHSKKCDHLLKSHLNNGLKLVRQGLDLLRHSSEDDVQISAINLFVQLVKAFSSKALITISQALIAELSSQGSESVKYRMTLYRAFEEISLVASFESASDKDILKARFQEVIDALDSSLKLELTIDKESAIVDCEHALEAWIALKGEDTYQPIKKSSSEEPECSYPTVDDKNKRVDLKPSESTYLNMTKPSSLRNKHRSMFESNFSLTRLEKENPWEYEDPTENFARSKYGEKMINSTEPQSRKKKSKIKLWKRTRNRTMNNNKPAAAMPSEITHRSSMSSQELEENMGESNNLSDSTPDDKMNIHKIQNANKKWCKPRMKIWEKKRAASQ